MWTRSHWVREDEADVIIVGAGPVGLWLAAELRLGGARVTVLERRPTRSIHSRAHTMHARTLEILAMRGIVGRWLEEGVQIPTTHYAMLSSRLDLSVLPTDYPFALFVPQVRTEELLEAYARASGVRVQREVEVRDVEATDTHVRVGAVDAVGELVFTAKYVVGCDGKRSVVRTVSGIGYTGTEGSTTAVLGDVRVRRSSLPPVITKHSEAGAFYAVKIDADRYRFVAIEHALEATPRPTALDFDEFRRTIQRLVGTDFGMHDPNGVTRFAASTFQADNYRKGRVFLAGDAAQVHFPMGGQGLNLGIQDAMNLGWKLGLVLRSAAAPSLLDTYEGERIPVGKAVITDTLAQTAVVAMPGPEGEALRHMMTEVLAENRALNAKFALAISGLGVAYPSVHGGNPLMGQRVPNLPLTDGSNLYGLLGAGKLCLIGIPESGLSHRLSPAVRRSLACTSALFASSEEPWEGVGAAIVRPDGHLLWAAARDAEQEGENDFVDALCQFLGEPHPRSADVQRLTG